MLDGGKELLRNFWYLAFSGDALPRGRMLAKTLMGEPMLFARTDDGEVFALRDICPHRGIPLRHGKFDGKEVECCYHGWRFGRDGRCTAIPSLVDGQAFHTERVSAGAYPCREVQGNVWVFVSGANPPADDALPPVPEIPGIGDVAPRVTIVSPFPCHTDHAAFGLMDPTHAAFVHTSWWWKGKADRLKHKEKHFEPAPLGWKMSRHPVPSANRAYRLLGNEVTTEIVYALPGIRTETVEGDKHSLVSLTAITPIDETTTEVHQCLYWTMGWLGPFAPLVKKLARTFLEQDRDVVVLQQEGLRHDPNLILIDDADTQAKWYARLKREWLAAEAEGRPFENPLEAATLRWRS
jgi:phenylpropionate dioxygenase-like ring-hydroxylating dioxygenase large terminal subunit